MARPQVEVEAPHRRAGAPCFADRLALDARRTYDDLQAYIPSLHLDQTDPIPLVHYGTCVLDNGELREADGRVIGNLHCGFEVSVRGVVDDLGRQVADLGRDVIAGNENARDRLHCVHSGDMTSCWFARSSDPDDWATYVYLVADSFTGEMLDGDDAVAFFSPRPVAKLEMRGDCH